MVWFEQFDDFFHLLDPFDVVRVDCLSVELAKDGGLLWREQIFQHFDYLSAEGVPAALPDLLALPAQLRVLSVLSQT